MKLISMTDFVLEQELPTYLQKDEFEEAYYKLHNYANFLKKPLTLEMFVPCDEDGNVLEEPNRISNMNWDAKKLEDWSLNCHEYQQAKERVLFDGFKLKDGFIIMPDKQFLDTSKLKNKIVENLINEHYTLTESAIKKLGL